MREANGVHVIANQVANAVGDFERQQTIWDAREGRHRGQGWELPARFEELFSAWMEAHQRLATAPSDSRAELEQALTAVRCSSEALLKDLSSRKDAGRLALAFDLFAASEQIMRQNLRRAHPAASELEIARLLEEWIRREPGSQRATRATP